MFAIIHQIARQIPVVGTVNPQGSKIAEPGASWSALSQIRIWPDGAQMSKALAQILRTGSLLPRLDGFRFFPGDHT